MDYDLGHCPLTLNTTRICGMDPIDVAINSSGITFTTMRPNAVILVNKDEVFDGIAAAPLVHFPIDAPILYTDGRVLNKKTLREILRLSPKGYKGVHVILVGNISDNVARELNMNGLRTIHVTGRNHYETACKIPDMRKDFKNILIVSGEDYSEGIMTVYWSAHHGDPILFVQKDSIPVCTLETIRKMHDINVYIVASTKTVSKAVENTLLNLENIKRLDRIDGRDPYAIAVNFTKYKDDKTEFGWGRDYIEGHAFTFGTLSHPMETIASLVFSHMGKHTPLLLVENNGIPHVVKEYIKSVKPIPPKKMPRPPFMHGFIIGDSRNISYDNQLMIEEVLSIDKEIM